MASRNGLSCLVVDDEPRLRQVLIQLLRKDGFRCVEAGNGVEALRAMEADPAPLVVSDLRMPELDGVGLLQHIMRRWPDTAMLMVSAVADVDVAVKCLKLGAFDYVSKPFNLEEVRVRVEQALQRRQLKLELKNHQEHLEARVSAQAGRIEELFLGAVQALAQALEAKDSYLRGHSLRVAQYAVATGRHMGLDQITIDTISLGARLHDIGKIGVSEELLHKPTSLTGDEYRHIMEHTVIGARILGPLLREAPQVITIVRSHHERMDGQGLPDGLRGEAVPPLARIVSVADAFDAMTSERPYRHSLPVSQALAELRRQRAVQWDAPVVDAFLAAFPDPARLPLASPEAPPTVG